MLQRCSVSLSSCPVSLSSLYDSLRPPPILSITDVITLSPTPSIRNCVMHGQLGADQMIGGGGCEFYRNKLFFDVITFFFFKGRLFQRMKIHNIPAEFYLMCNIKKKKTFLVKKLIPPPFLYVHPSLYHIMFIPVYNRKLQCKI